MGRSAGPLHEPGNHGAFERRSHRQAARRGRLTNTGQTRRRARSRRRSYTTARDTITFLLAVAMRDAIVATQTDPKSSSDLRVANGYQIARLIRNAFAHSPFDPTWSIDSDCVGRV